MDDIEIVSIRPAIGWGTVRAFCSVRIGSIVVNEVRILENSNGARYVTMPSRKERAADGRMVYHDVVEFSDRALAEQVRRAVLSAWEQGTLPDFAEEDFQR